MIRSPRLLVMASACMLAIHSHPAHLPAAVNFPEAFAPQESFVEPLEKPFRQDLCLNGSWKFQPVALPDSFREGESPAPALPPPAADRWDKTPIRIPSPWNVNAFTTRDGRQDGGDFRTFPSYPKEWENTKLGWLRRTFTVPADWKPGRRLLLHFDAVAGDAQVIVNGKTVGSHFDIFLPFEVDVTDAVQYGADNELLVGVRKASLFDQRGEIGRRTYQGGSFWGQFAVGIWQDVFLVARPAVRASDVYVVPRFDEDRLEARVTLTNDTDQPAVVTVDAKALPWIPNAPVPKGFNPMPSTRFGPQPGLTLAPVQVTVPPRGSTQATLQGIVGGRLKPWVTTDPNLYGLVVDTAVGGRAADVSCTRFGWRQITFRGAEVLLNGKPIVLRGDSWHFMGIPQMTRRYPWAWFTALHDAGLNAVRLHAQPYPSFYLDVADEMGIMVLDETAMWASDGEPKLDSPAYWKDSEQHLTGLLLRDRNHPSVFGWSVSNEIIPVVKNVMRNPPGVLDTLLREYTVWVDLCHRYDPSRPWISADGEDDGQGRLPTYMVHYGGPGGNQRAAASGKPWGVGEAGDAYYGTPDQVSEHVGGRFERAYESFQGRMEGVAISSYAELRNQHDNNAKYRSVFNLVWYGLEPLPIGMRDLTRPPAISDGIAFAGYREGQPGVQPERLGPYCTTLNPGYDPTLPLYKPWPLFEVIKDAAAEPIVRGKWATAQSSPPPQPPPPAPRALKNVGVLGGPGSQLAQGLTALGVPVTPSNGRAPDALFIDGEHPPGREVVGLINGTLNAGGTVCMWGVDPAATSTLDMLLPARLEITERHASSLLPVTPDPLTAGLVPSAMYFSEQRPSEVVLHGLAGPLVAGGRVLLKASDTDWEKWNKQSEETKTAMILRSERESKPAGAVLVAAGLPAGNPGRLLVTTLPATPRSSKAIRLDRAILSNMGISLGAGADEGKPLLADGRLVRALAAGFFPQLDDRGGKPAPVDPAAPDDKVRAGMEAASGRLWKPFFQEGGTIKLDDLGLSGPMGDSETYVSFWLFSPRSLEDLLLEPNLPKVGLKITRNDGIRAWLNGTSIIDAGQPGAPGEEASAKELKLRQGWNRVLIRVTHASGMAWFKAQFTCNQPAFLGQLDSALEKP